MILVRAFGNERQCTELMKVANHMGALNSPTHGTRDWMGSRNSICIFKERNDAITVYYGSESGAAENEMLLSLPEDREFFIGQLENYLLGAKQLTNTQNTHEMKFLVKTNEYLGRALAQQLVSEFGFKEQEKKYIKGSTFGLYINTATKHVDWAYNDSSYPNGECIPQTLPQDYETITDKIKKASEPIFKKGELVYIEKAEPAADLVNGMVAQVVGKPAANVRGVVRDTDCLYVKILGEEDYWNIGTGSKLQKPMPETILQHLSKVAAHKGYKEGVTVNTAGSHYTLKKFSKYEYMEIGSQLRLWGTWQGPTGQTEGHLPILNGSSWAKIVEGHFAKFGGKPVEIRTVGTTVTVESQGETFSYIGAVREKLRMFAEAIPLNNSKTFRVGDTAPVAIGCTCGTMRELRDIVSICEELFNK